MTGILQVSSDKTLLNTREMLLKQFGYGVVSAIGAAEAMEHCTDGGFDLLIVGHSMPHEDKQRVVKTFRAHSNAPVLALHRDDEPPVEGADFEIPPDPHTVVSAVASLIASRSKGAS